MQRWLGTLQTRTPTLLVAILIGIVLLLFPSCVTQEYTVTETYYETEYRTRYKTETYTETENLVTPVAGEDILTPKVQWRNRGLAMTEPSYRSFSSWRDPAWPDILYFGYELPNHDASHIEVYFAKLPTNWNAQGPFRGRVWVYDLTGLEHISNCSTTSPEFGDWEEQTNSTLQRATELSEDESASPVTSSHLEYPALIYDTTGVTDLAIIRPLSYYSPYAYSSDKPSSGPTVKHVKLVWTDEVIEQTTVTKERQVPYQVPYEVEKQRTVTKTKKVPFWEAILGE